MVGAHCFPSWSPGPHQLAYIPGWDQGVASRWKGLNLMGLMLPWVGIRTRCAWRIFKSLSLWHIFFPSWVFLCVSQWFCSRTLQLPCRDLSLHPVRFPSLASGLSSQELTSLINYPGPHVSVNPPLKQDNNRIYLIGLWKWVNEIINVKCLEVVIW